MPKPRKPSYLNFDKAAYAWKPDVDCANYKGGRKYDKDAGYEPKERGTGDPEKAESAQIFYKLWKKAEAEPRYAARKKEWKAKYG